MLRRENLKTFREKEGLTQQEMADKLEVSLIQYQFIESGRRNPSFKVLENFKKAFAKASVDKIFLA